MGDRRWVIVGAGAVGGSIGARLHRAGHDVVLVARGAHLEAMRRDGLRVRSPDGERVERVPVADRVPTRTERDLVVLATKAQHTAEALAGVDPGPLVVAQNGVLEAHLDWEGPVYGAMVWAPMSHLAPGVVDEHSAPIPGVVDLGLWSGGTDPVAQGAAADLRDGGFDSRAVGDIAAWKYGKLLTNLGNAVEALCGPVDAEPLLALLNREAVACYAAAGIEVADVLARCAGVGLKPIGGERRGGGSSWQSLARGTGNIEADALNGEIVRLGERYGVATPANRAVRDRAVEVAANRGKPGGIDWRSLRQGG